MKKIKLLSLFLMLLIVSSINLISCELPGQVNEQVSEPEITSSGGDMFDTTSLITITSTDGATIYYTLDGSDPTESSNEYSGPFTITNDTTVKAIAMKLDFKDSEIQIKEYLNGASVIAISAGTNYSFILQRNGDLIGFGDNEYKQLGTGGVGDLEVPTKVASDVIAVDTSTKVTAFIDKDNKLYMMGSNDDGQFGDGTDYNIVEKSPKIIRSNVSKVSLSDSASGIITTDEKLLVSGSNGSGQIGQGSTTDKLSTFTSYSPNNIADVFLNDTNSYSTFIITTEDKKLLGTGPNNYNKLGLVGTNNRYVPEWVNKSNLEIKDVSSSFTHTLFLGSNGKLWGVGSNLDKQILNTDEDIYAFFTLIEEDVIGMTAGVNCTFYITDNNDLYAFGNNNWGRLGLGDTEDIVSTPTFVMANVKDVSSRFDHTLFLKTDGTVYAAGHNHSGCLGDGTRIDSTSPVVVILPIIN